MAKKVVITNVYNNTALPNRGFKIGHGQSFFIETPEMNILFETGLKGKDLLHNMTLLGLDWNSISYLVLSHGHYDHTYGLPELLRNWNTSQKLTVIVHPAAFEPKGAYRRFFGLQIRVPIGFPRISKKLQEKLEFKFIKEPYSINSYISVSGEIPRKERDGTSDRLLHKKEGKWVKDPLVDDMALIIRAKEGLVVICGCCHSGVINTLRHVRNIYPDQTIHALIGGTHMINFYNNDLKHVGDVLEKEFDLPTLYLNHCTGNHAIAYLIERFDLENVKYCHVGTRIEFALE